MIIEKLSLIYFCLPMPQQIKSITQGAASWMVLGLHPSDDRQNHCHALLWRPRESCDPRIPRCKRFGGSLGVLLQSYHHFHPEYNLTEIKDFFTVSLSTLFKFFSRSESPDSNAANINQIASLLESSGITYAICSIDFSCILMHPYSPQKEKQVKGTLCTRFFVCICSTILLLVPPQLLDLGKSASAKWTTC